MRLIDADMIPNYKLDVLAKAGEMQVPCKFRIVHWKDIEAMPTIDPESLPVVQQLRAELEHEKKRTQSAIKCMRSHGWCAGCKHFGWNRGCLIGKDEECVKGNDFYELRED